MRLSLACSYLGLEAALVLLTLLVTSVDAVRADALVIVLVDCSAFLVPYRLLRCMLHGIVSAWELSSLEGPSVLLVDP